MSTAIEKREGAEMDRAAFVSSQLMTITNSTKQNFFVMCELLLEAYDNNYHVHYGYPKFGDWIDASDFDMSGRSAYYLVNIGKRMVQLGLTKEAVAEIPVSKLKEILSLDPSSHTHSIQALLGEADQLTTDEIKEKVKGLKSKAGEETYSHLNLKIPALVKETVEEAFELVRRLHGSTLDQEGNIVDISDGKCLEYLAVAYLQDPNNHGEGMDEQHKNLLHAAVINDEVRVVG